MNESTLQSSHQCQNPIVIFFILGKHEFPLSSSSRLKAMCNFPFSDNRLADVMWSTCFDNFICKRRRKKKTLETENF